MNGKVSGRVFVGNSPSIMENNDLHSYVVANDGRAYVAISNISESLGPSLQPLSSLGGVIGWAFALEQPGYRNGFSVVGEATSSGFCFHLVSLCVRDSDSRMFSPTSTQAACFPGRRR